MKVAILAFALAGAAWAQLASSVEYRSIKEKRAEVRAEPEEKAEVLWRVWKYMPVEVAAYKGDWRLVRDLDGDEGWVHKDALSEVPTVMVRTKEAKLRSAPGGKILWVLDRGYPMRVFRVRGDWLEVSDLDEVSGWIHASTVWGNTRPRNM